jgi:hemerythrin-like domain-containing protein
MSDTPSFMTLLDTHKQLDELFLLQQEALMELDLELAVQRLEAFKRELLAHIQMENEILIPIYAQRVERMRGAGPELFTGEHERMQEALARFDQTVESLRGSGLNRRRAIEFLDQQYMFKHLLEHHDDREARFFFPNLDRVTSEAERRELIARCMAPPAP